MLSKTMTLKATISAATVPTQTSSCSKSIAPEVTLAAPLRNETTAAVNITAGAFAAPAQQAAPVVLLGILPPLLCCLFAALLIYFARRRRAASSKLTSKRPKPEAAADCSDVLTLNPLAHSRPASSAEGGTAEEENPLPVADDVPDRPSAHSSDLSSGDDTDAQLLPVREADSKEETSGAQEMTDASPSKRSARVLDIRWSRKQQAYKKVVDANMRLASINALLGAHRAIGVFTRRATLDETTAALLVQRAWRMRRTSRLRSHWDHVAKFDGVDHISDSRRVVAHVLEVEEHSSATAIVVGRKAKAAVVGSSQEEGDGAAAGIE